jgi:hypothetical protein
VIEGCVGFVERRWRWALAALLACDGVLLLYMGRGLTFFYDEWDFVTHDYGGGIHSVLVAHVGNMSVLPVLVYKVLFHLAGLDHYTVYRVVLIALHLLAGVLIFALASKRVSRVAGLLTTALILFLGAAWEDLLWPFQIGYMLSITGGLGAWLLLEREERWGDAGAMACLVVSAGSSSLGIAIIVGVAVELACRRQWARLWVVVVPSVLYILWYIGYGESQITENGVINAPGFAMDMVASAFGGLAGRALEWGRPLAVAGLIVLVWRLSRPRTVSPRLAGLLAAGLSLWIITSLARSTISAPEASRYIYLGAVVIVLIAVEFLRGITIPTRSIAIASVLVAIAVVSGLTVLHNGASGLRGNSRAVAAELGALEIAAAYAPPGYQPDQIRAPQISAGPYLHTVRAIGSSPADPPSKIAALDPGTRAAADGVLIALEHPAVTPLRAAAGSTVLGTVQLAALVGGTQVAHGGCLEVLPTTGAALTAVFDLGHGALSVRNRGAAPAPVAFRRFGDEFHPVQPVIGARSSSLLSVAPDALAVPWRGQVTTVSPLLVCRARA